MHQSDYQNLQQKYLFKMEQILRKNKYDKQNNDNYTYKTKNDLRTQCEQTNHSLTHCESIKRIQIALEAYNELMHNDYLWGRVPISPLLSFNNIYEQQQCYVVYIIYVLSTNKRKKYIVIDDFLHIKLNHIDQDQKISDIIFTHFALNILCDDMGQYQGLFRRDRNKDKSKLDDPINLSINDQYVLLEKDLFYGGRHIMDQNTDFTQIMTNKDIVYQKEMDKIYRFFLYNVCDKQSQITIFELNNKQYKPPC